MATRKPTVKNRQLHAAIWGLLTHAEIAGRLRMMEIEREQFAAGQQQERAHLQDECRKRGHVLLPNANGCAICGAGKRPPVGSMHEAMFGERAHQAEAA